MLLKPLHARFVATRELCILFIINKKSVIIACFIRKFATDKLYFRSVTRLGIGCLVGIADCNDIEQLIAFRDVEGFEKRFRFLVC